MVEYFLATTKSSVGLNYIFTCFHPSHIYRHAKNRLASIILYIDTTSFEPLCCFSDPLNKAYTLTCWIANDAYCHFD